MDKLCHKESSSKSVEWLETRYPFDARARSHTLETLALDSFQNKSAVNIVDVGAGTGANTRYYQKLLPNLQKWTLIESNSAFSNQWKGSFMEWCNQNRLSYRDENVDEIVLHNTMQSLTVCWRSGSALDLAKLTIPDKVDLVVANALFDLFSVHQFENFASTLAEYKIPLLTTLNYQSMLFIPADPLDRKYIQLYESHMQRPRPEGNAMGSNCSQHAGRIMNELGASVYREKSTWDIRNQDRQMLTYLLNFMQTSIVELLTSPKDVQQLDEWINSKQKEMEADKLRLVIEHSDMFFEFG